MKRTVLKVLTDIIFRFRYGARHTKEHNQIPIWRCPNDKAHPVINDVPRFPEETLIVCGICKVPAIFT